MDDPTKYAGILDRLREGFRGHSARHAADVIRSPEVRSATSETARNVAVDLLKQMAPGAAAGGALGAVAAGSKGGSPGEGGYRGMSAGAVGGLVGGKPVPAALLGGLFGGAAGGLVRKEASAQEKPMKNKYAGVTLDWYDDNGSTLKSKFPTADKLPDIIKEADVRPMEKLADEDFALIAVDEGNVLRKFACYDPGTTAMSVIYFMEHGEKLPEGAQKMAAANLVDACQQFELMPPEALLKVAVGGTSVSVAWPSIGLKQRAVHGLVGAGLGGYLGGSNNTKDTLRDAAVGAAGGLAGGHMLSKAVESPIGELSRRALAQKMMRGSRNPGEVREVMDLLTSSALSNRNAMGVRGSLLGGAVAGSAAHALPHKNKKAMVDVTGQRPAPKMKVASSDDINDYAVVMNGKGYYPIHTWDLVKKAEVYFQEERGRMQPELRRQYAVKLAAKATEMGYPIDPEVLEAGATEWAPSGHLKAAVEMRKIACQPGGDRKFLDQLFEKRASMEPGTYAEVLRRFDVQHGFDGGWDRIILDPWASTFGMQKTADVVWEDGNDRVTSDQLVSLAQNHLKRLRQILTEGMCKEFQKDPVGIFESMPLPQKRIISRLAADHPENSEITQAVV